ncbi:hypothetical protein N0V85_003770 [Neurospora sp. IMI 360204]|nr:hypothetical protein N0V85_003770 [Neurospora sp. IMI 360204]
MIVGSLVHKGYKAYVDNADHVADRANHPGEDLDRGLKSDGGGGDGGEMGILSTLGEKKDISKKLNAKILKLSKDLKAWDVPKMDVSSLASTIGLLYQQRAQRFRSPLHLRPLKNLDTTAKIFLPPGQLGYIVIHEQFDDLFDNMTDEYVRE